MFVEIYLIGMIVSSIIFARFFFKYGNPKNRFGLTNPDVANEQEHYGAIALISWVYPIVWIIIIIRIIIPIICNVSVNFIKFISKL